MNPYLTAKSVTIPERVAEDHKTLMENCDKIAAFEKQFTANKDDSEKIAQLKTEFQKAIIDMYEPLLEHLKEVNLENFSFFHFPFFF